MFFKILGSAAGGGFPQWNCNCRNCKGVRSGKIRAAKRTQSSAAFSFDGQSWMLINASPDVLFQLGQFLPPKESDPVRGTAVKGLILTDAQVDHTAGLLMLREGCPMPLYCTAEVHGELTENLTTLKILKHWDGGFDWTQIDLQKAVPISKKDFGPAEIFPVKLYSNAPPFSEFRNKPRPGDSIGIRIRNPETGGQLVYAPDLGLIDDEIRTVFESSDIVFTDGTFSYNNEMLRSKTGEKTALDMGHMPVFDENGTFDFFQSLKKPQVYLTHVNNTNPILDEDSEESRKLGEAGILVAFDGITVEF